MSTIPREIDRDELLDIAIDVGALADYVVGLYGIDDLSAIYQRTLGIQARLMIELGLYRRADDGYVESIDETYPFAGVETSRAREWLKHDLGLQLTKLTAKGGAS